MKIRLTDGWIGWGGLWGGKEREAAKEPEFAASVTLKPSLGAFSRGGLISALPKPKLTSASSRLISLSVQ